jgi:hypothetical protein
MWPTWSRIYPMNAFAWFLFGSIVGVAGVLTVEAAQRTGVRPRITWSPAEKKAATKAATKATTKKADLAGRGR